MYVVIPFTLLSHYQDDAVTPNSLPAGKSSHFILLHAFALQFRASCSYWSNFRSRAHSMFSSHGTVSSTNKMVFRERDRTNIAGCWAVVSRKNKPAQVWLYHPVSARSYPTPRCNPSIGVSVAAAGQAAKWEEFSVCVVPTLFYGYTGTPIDRVTAREP